MTKIVHPIFRIKDMLGFNPENDYIISTIAWRKGCEPEEIIAAGHQAAQLLNMGFRPIDKQYEADEGNHKVFQVSTLTHPTLGEVHIGIVGGPDFAVIKESIEGAARAIEEKAQFKQNVHELWDTVQ